MTQRPLPAKAQAGLYALLALALISSLSFLLDSIKYFRMNGTELTGSSGYIVRFDALRKELPTFGKVGYWSNADQDPGDLEFHLTQFALAPTLLEKTTSHQLVVGNIAKDPKPEELQAMGLTLVKDYGLGVVLYRRNR
jgi:hypothetical protein